MAAPWLGLPRRGASGGVGALDVLVLDTQGAGNPVAQRLHAVAFGGVVAGGEVAEAVFQCAVGAVLRNFTGDKCSAAR